MKTCARYLVNASVYQADDSVRDKKGTPPGVGDAPLWSGELRYWEKHLEDLLDGAVRTSCVQLAVRSRVAFPVNCIGMRTDDNVHQEKLPVLSVVGPLEHLALGLSRVTSLDPTALLAKLVPADCARDTMTRAKSLENIDAVKIQGSQKRLASCSVRQSGRISRLDLHGDR